MINIMPQSVAVLMPRMTAATDVNGVATAYLKFPAAGRTISGGNAWFGNHTNGDYVIADVFDLDNVLGSGQIVVSSWSDLDCPTANQGWYCHPVNGVKLEPIVSDDPTDIEPNTNLYLRVRGFKAAGAAASADNLYVNIRWGRRIR